MTASTCAERKSDATAKIDLCCPVSPTSPYPADEGFTVPPPGRFPLDPALHRDLGAAIAAASTTPPIVTEEERAEEYEEVAEEKMASAAIPNFDDAAASYSSFSTAELVR